MKKIKQFLKEFIEKSTVTPENYNPGSSPTSDITNISVEVRMGDEINRKVQK